MRRTERARGVKRHELQGAPIPERADPLEGACHVCDFKKGCSTLPVPTHPLDLVVA